MQKYEKHDAGHSASTESPSQHNATSGGFQPSAKLRDKLEKLSKWRIDQSSVEFSKDAREFRGGNATVSRAFLVSPSAVQDMPDQPDPNENKSLVSGGPDEETTRLGKDVAVKKINISSELERVLGLTLREAEFLVGLSHENVIELEGFVEDLSAGIIWLVFPWENNGTLKDFIVSADWEIPERISLINDVTSGVEYLHNRQPPICHGDLKSINVLVNAKCRAVITDFGSARRRTTEDLEKAVKQAESEPQAAVSFEASFSVFTNTITLTGDQYTLRWAAPELLMEGVASLWSDIWALGWVAYEVMTNSIPFQDVKDAMVIKRVVQGDLPSITDDARMSLIQALCSLIVVCWSVDPRKRPTARDCRETLKWMPMIIPNPLRTLDAADSRARSPALSMKLGVMYWRQGNFVNALGWFTNALESYGDTGDKKGKVAALMELARVHRFQHKDSQAVPFYSEALQIHAEIGDKRGRAEALFGLAEVHRVQEEYTQAVTFYSECLQICTDLGLRNGIADSLSALADMHLAQTEYSEATTFYSEALQIRTDLGDRRGRARELWGLGEVHRLQKEYNTAITLYSESLAICTDIGNRYGKAFALHGLAAVHRDQYDHKNAIRLYSEAAEVYEQIGSTEDAAHASSQVRRLSEQERPHDDPRR